MSAKTAWLAKHGYCQRQSAYPPSCIHNMTMTLLQVVFADSSGTPPFEWCSEFGIPFRKIGHSQGIILGMAKFSHLSHDQFLCWEALAESECPACGGGEDSRVMDTACRGDQALWLCNEMGSNCTLARLSVLQLTCWHCRCISWPWP
jgi:hypothetical protein